ncbi:MAG: phosphatidate cytidylyltransferase [Micrococcales bacterium]|nr:phosphatidate cytidylyltransferase [Micrococcales bacterium]
MARSHLAQPKQTGGRNLAVAVPVALGLLAVLVSSVWFSPWPFVGLVCVALGLASWELSQALTHARINLPFAPLALGGVGTQIAAAISGPPGVLAGLALTAALTVAWTMADVAPRLPPARDLYAAFFAVVYLPLLASLVVLLAFEDFHNRGRFLVLLLVLLPVASDTGGFFAGTWLGRHKLAPQVSPKKTWEGLAGSLLLSIAVAVVAIELLDGPWWLGLALGFGGAFMATLGDLTESLLKRELGLKDMGWLLPGHGGVLDRVDSILLTAPLAYILLTAWVRAG